MTKIDIFSGFLGAGKTTLIKKLLADGFGTEKLVLIENEFGEIGIDGAFLKDAGINTVICIVVVFTVLIFIALIISLFKFINKAETAIAARKSRKESDKNIAETAINNTISQITAKEEEELNDLELVAVIAAAIAAATGSSTDDFVVRSIRKVRR